MDAVKFLEEFRRMCDSHKECETCPFHSPPKYYCLWDVLADSECEITERAVSIVEKWSAEHPVKTRLRDFLEKFPNASLGSSGTPLYLPRPFGYCGRETCQGCDHWGSSDCWILPVEE